MLGVDFSMLFMAATYVLVVAPLYMLMVMRVNRFGVTAFYACVMALVYLMFGNLWYMLPFYLVGGLAIDALFLRTAAQRAKPNRIVAAWATFSALYSLSSNCCQASRIISLISTMASRIAYRAIRENQGFLLCLTTQPP